MKNGYRHAQNGHADQPRTAKGVRRRMRKALRAVTDLALSRVVKGFAEQAPFLDFIKRDCVLISAPIEFPFRYHEFGG